VSAPAVIRKTSPPKDPLPRLADYAAARSSFTWDAAAEGLGLAPGGPLNLGELAVLRGGALVWHGARGEEERLSGADLSDRSSRFAAWLRREDVQPGDRVLFQMRNLPELACGLLGALRAGAAVSVLGRSKNPDHLLHLLQRTEPAVMVVEPGTKDAVDALRASCPRLRRVVVVRREAAPFAKQAGDVAWEETADAAAATFVPLQVAGDHPAWIHYSEVGMTGSTAPHAAALALANSAALALDLRAGDGAVTLAVPGDPLYVPYAILAPLLSGATAHLFEDPVRFGGYAKLRDAIQVWYSSPKAIDVVLRSDPGLADLLARCRHIAVTWPYDAALMIMTQLSYGSPLHPTWWARDLGAIQSAEFRSGDIRVGSIGRPLPGVEMEIDAASGCLAVRPGPGTPFAGYWNEAEETARRVKKGWYVTDHKARIDADGCAWIVA
jgi:acetyl-CoA synthetase